MRFPTTVQLTLCFAACLWGGLAHGQVVATSAAAGQGGFRQASLPSSQSIVNARRDAAENLQINVTVRYLMVDAETRDAIYRSLNRQSIVSNVQTPPAFVPTNLGDSVSPAASLQQIQAPSRVTTCTLSEPEIADVLKKIGDSANSQINAAPKIILLDGNEVEMTDLVQRPFVIDFQLDGDKVKPTVHALEDGIRLRLVANLADPKAGPNQELDLRCELTLMRILDVKTDEVFGIKDEPLAVQVPVQQITSAVASRQLLLNQTLLIDPHVSQSQSVASETGVPMFSKIPYVNRAFKNVSVGTVQQYMMLLLQPTIEPMAR